MKNIYDLKDILDINRWEALQDSVASTTGMALITVDYRGIPVTHHSNCTPFCDQVRNNSELNYLCHKCDARGGLEAVYANSPYTYFCHFGILDIAIPIIIEDTYLGAIMVGQIKPFSDKIELNYDHIFMPKNKNLINLALSKYEQEYSIIPQMPLDKIDKITETLNHLAHYIVEQAIDKQKKIDIYSSLIPKHKTQDLPSSNTSMPSDFYNKIPDSSINRIISESGIENFSNINATLKSAIQYIFQNKGKLISLEEISAICYLSPSYFSRLFKQEIGMNYSTYISKMKMLWAKQLFFETDMSVTQVGNALGYSDTGYFIKKFKNTYGVTPGKYNSKFIH